jgi:DNA-binding IclR family transcriptional regulator
MAKRRVTAQRKCISARLPTKTVKSAGRVLEILAFFDDLQRHSTVMEIAEGLGYPQSSTSALLRSLVALGYLNYDRYSRTYIPSCRVALLGSWLNSQFITEGAVVSMMKELNEETGDTIVLGVRNSLHVQYIHVIQATNPVRLHMALGTVRPIVASGGGFAVLSALNDAEVVRLVMRSNDELEGKVPRVNARDVLERVASVRQKGYSFTYDMVTPGGGIIAALLPRLADQPHMFVGIGGITDILRAREDELAGLLKRQIELRFGKPRSNPAPPRKSTADPRLQGISAGVIGR